MRRFAGLVAGLLLALTNLTRAQDGPTASIELAEKATSILKERCSRCHGGAAKHGGLDVLNRRSLLKERGDLANRITFVTPGDVDKSQLVAALDGDYMPKQGSPEAKAMTADERATIKTWVADGAKFPIRRDLRFISDKQLLMAIRDHLLKTKADDRPYLRFFTLTHLQNNETINERDLRFYRAALAKAVNSLSQERDLYFLQALPGTGESIYVVDLRKLGWVRRNLWNQILRHYPYGLKYDFVKDEELKQVSKDVTLLSGGEMPHIRGDWFVVTATQPPLYYEILDIPNHLDGLLASDRLDINLHERFLKADLQRSGYAKSGVSSQNRLLERHTSKSTPYFWISWDFLPNRAKGDLVRFPLGPVFAGNPYRGQAFVHDGGEIIWSLPNGMQGYMLVKGDGTRIDSGPVDVVFDRDAILGTPSIINGISCMYCHRHGMIGEFTDEVRGSDALSGEAREMVLKLFPPNDDMQRLVQQDEAIFMRSLEQLIGPILITGKDSQKTIREFREPVGEVAEMYSRDLTVLDIALELGIEKPEVLQAKIEANRELLRYGLGTIVQDPPGTIKREKWHSRDGTSLMQDVSTELRLGTPTLR